MGCVGSGCCLPYPQPLLHPVAKDPKHSFVKLDIFSGAEICYTLTGEEKSPLVVMCHGAEMGQWVWQQQFAGWLVSRGFRVLTFDAFGHGESDLPATPAHDVAFYNKYIHELLTVLKLADTKKTWIGAGGGGAISVEYCAAYADTIERLVLFAPAGFVDAFALKCFQCCPCAGDFYIGCCTCDIRSKFNSIIYDKAKHPEAAKLVREKVDWSLSNNPGFKTSLYLFLKDFPLGAVEKEAKLLGSRPNLPILLFWGDKDFEGGWGTPIAHLDKYKACMPNATVQVVKNTHHALWLEEPELVFKLVGDWLDATGKKAGAWADDKKGP